MNTSPKERNLLGGFDAWKQIMPQLTFIYFIFGWFAVTLEVFLRRDFGERYFNRVNFFAGLIVLLGFNFGQNTIGGVWRQGEEPTWKESMMWIFLLAYIGFSIIHLFTIWWRDRAGRPLHSLDSGKSWLEPMAGLILVTCNALATPIIRLLSKALPHAWQQDMLRILPAFRDKRSFAEGVLEPLACFIVMFSLFLGKIFVPMMWVFFSLVALFFYTSFRHQAERHKFLDIQDNVIEAQELQSALRGTSQSYRISESVKDSLKHLAEQAESNPEVVKAVEDSPSILEAMEALNPKLRKIAPSMETPANDTI